MDSTERFAVVTGAGSGIGRAVSLALAREGFIVAITGRRMPQLEQTASMGESGRLHAIAADISQLNSVRDLFAQVKKTFGRLDLLFNNAGIGAPPVPMEDLSLEQWRRVVDINLTGTFLCAQEAMRIMKTQAPRGGRIINNGSISAHSPRPNSAAYTATKHAITGLTKSISLDGRAFDIACGQIDIGNAATELTAPMSKGVPQASGIVSVEPTMDVEHVAQAVVQMAALPLAANVQFLTIMATKMPFVGRG